jgi:transmembrane sensor
VKDYALFIVKDFVLDEYFQTWVFDPSGSSNSFWQSWLEEYPHKLGEIQEARSILLQFNFSNHNLKAEEVSKLWNQIRSVDHKNLSRKSFIPKVFVWYSATAAVLLIGFTSFFWLAEEPVREYKTAFGETKTITLPDSSTVILNSNSSLRISAVWKNKSEREVWLSGEAFFSVIHKINDQPFKVRTKENIAIEVLGTTFNVYDRNQTKIVLNSGSIQLSLPTVQADEKVFMKPGELVEYDEKKYIKRQVDPKVYTAWTEHNLILNHTSLTELIRMIKDNYGLDVEVKEHLLDQTISGSMPISNAENLLQQIAKAFRLKIVKEENRIYMRE